MLIVWGSFKSLMGNGGISSLGYSRKKKKKGGGGGRGYGIPRGIEEIAKGISRG